MERAAAFLKATSLCPFSQEHLFLSSFYPEAFFLPVAARLTADQPVVAKAYWVGFAAVADLYSDRLFYLYHSALYLVFSVYFGLVFFSSSALHTTGYILHLHPVDCYAKFVYMSLQRLPIFAE